MSATNDSRSPKPGFARVLVIDDEPEIGTAVRMGLASGGFKVDWVATAQAGMDRIATWHPDVIILDLSLPDIDGIEVCKAIRGWSPVPIIVLSIRDQDRDKIAALENGADDYLTKPFSLPELQARVRVALRHAANTAGGDNSDTIFQTGDLTIDFERRVVKVRSQDVHLNPTEYAVLQYLAVHAGKVITHQTLLRAVWGPQYEDAVQNLRVVIAQLRRKLETDPSRPRLVLTDPGIGYRLKLPE